MESEASELRRELGMLGPRGRGARVPAGLRAAIGGYARRESARGVSVRGIAVKIGVSYESVRRWAEQSATCGSQSSASRSLVPVMVREVAGESGRGGALSVQSPGGYRVEGLSLEQAAELLRRVG